MDGDLLEGQLVLEESEEEEEDEDEDEDEDSDEFVGDPTRFPRWVHAHADVPVVPFWELPARMGVYVRSPRE